MHPQTALSERIRQRTARLPRALRWLRLVAGFESLRATERWMWDAGRRLNSSRLSQWESGEQLPNVLSLAGYLDALGFDFRDLETALEVAGLSPHDLRRVHDRRILATVRKGTYHGKVTDFATEVTAKALKPA